MQFEADEIAEILLVLAQAANGLSLGGRQQSLQQLTAIVRTDPLWGVRHRCLEALVEVAGGSSFSGAAVQSALEDANPEVRYLAAIQPRVEGVAVLRQLVMSASSSEELRAKALRRLAQRLSDSELLPYLDPLLGARSRTVRHTAFEVAEHIKHRPLAARLLTLLDRKDLAGAERIARAVANIGGPRMKRNY
jgi:HEAT repeat protein